MTTSPAAAPFSAAPTGGGPARRLVLFGPMRFEHDGLADRIPSGDAQRLLSYLALHPRAAHRREALAELLWPDAGRRGRRNLTDNLYRIRRRLGDGWLQIDSDALRCAPSLTVDVWDFDELVASARISDLQAAIDLYTGELVPGVYDEWAVEHRAARQQAYASALRRLIVERERAGDLTGALTRAEQLLASEPLDEPTHQIRLRLLGRLGRYAAVVEHYEQLCRLLDEQLGVRPQPTTTEMVDQLASERSAAPASADELPFIGRAEERARSLDAVESMFEGRGAILCVEGVAGIGKSRLLDEIIRSARWRGAVVLGAGVPEVPESSPMAPIARALAPVLAGSRRFAIEATLEASMRRELGEIHPDWLAVGEPQPQSRDSVGRLEQSLRALGAAVAGVGKVVVAIDDLQWASAATWNALAALADGLVTNGALVVAAYRRPDVERTAGWSVLTGWDRRGVAHFVSLTPFEARDIAELLGGVEDVEPHEVLAVTGGVPFYVVEWSSTRHEHDRGADGAARLRQRIAELDPTSRSVLAAAAVLGSEIDFREWMATADASAAELATVADLLIASRWVVTTASGHAFTHDLIRGAVYEQIPENDRKRFHRRAADTVACHDPGNAPARAYHLDRAGRRRDAAAMYRRAAASHRAASAFHDAIEAWSRAFELVGAARPTERLTIALDLAEVCEIVGEHELQRPILDEASAIARSLEDDPALLRALLLAGGMAARTAEVHLAEKLLDEARDLATRLGDQRRLADAIYRRADLLAQLGQWPEAREQFVAAYELVGASDDLWLRGRVLRGLAISEVRTGRPSDATSWLEIALHEQRAAGDRMNELVTSTNLLAAYYELGSFDELVRTAEQCLPLARSFGDPVSVGIVRHHIGLAALGVGDRVRARREMVAAREAFGAAGRRRLVALSANTLGLVAEDDGDHVEAIELYSEAISIAESVEAEIEIAYASHDLGALLFESGRSDAAAPLLRRSIEAWRRAGHPLMQAKSEAYLGLCLVTPDGGQRGRADAGRDGDREVAAIVEDGLQLWRAKVAQGECPQIWMWALARLLEAVDRQSEAFEVLTTARDELLRQARSISDPVQRKRFFEDVPRNRAIIARYDELRRSAATTVRLARADAPLGRTLRDQELIQIVWTPSAPDDDAIDDPVERRRHRLGRLLSEANRCGAAPTDDDLATALGVSRRTILRDMAAIGQRDDRPTTRRRARSPHTSS